VDDTYVSKRQSKVGELLILIKLSFFSDGLNEVCDRIFSITTIGFWRNEIRNSGRAMMIVLVLNEFLSRCYLLKDQDFYKSINHFGDIKILVKWKVLVFSEIITETI